ncbi:lipopolysaccharide biosynthesis protein [Streptomyces sp. PSKA54]|uniref:Lipopolysaccharide biosynthesis protein n=1 Tax=Streptomyces himalayensis subsp. aureolus TaxID=2758039 RepID=A0A7W2HIR2_9ACTN|nr:lipopolysaccharide biosynthesis protein [Streptomyces himalayensis]MBA4865094.1 lipopolysaccharide biosynthesis protein [Streptomyces himalayensis subsp. aureolus]
MSDTTTTAQVDSSATPPAEPEPSAGRRLRLPGRGKGSGGTPLFRNAYALMLNTGISAVLGLGFWLAAARYYSEDAVGQGSAAIAAMKLLAGLTAVTLTGALARFIPVAGRATGRLIFHIYAGSSVIVALAAVAFLLTLDVWGPSYRFLYGTVNGLGFIAAVVAWSLLTLQDGVLTGLRSALWVPVGNTVFSAVKLALLVAFAVALPTTGVFASWVAAIAASVVPLGWLVFRRLVPRHVKATKDHIRPPTMRELGRFLAGDYTGSLFSLAVVYLVPVIVAAQVSSADNAYFYITATIGGTINLLAINMGASLTVEGSHDPAQLAANTRAALRRMARIMLPVAGVLFIGAPWILRVFGEGYADAATPLLRLFAVGAVLRVVMETYFAVLRAQSRTSGLAYLQGLLCFLVLGLTLVLLPRMGLTGAGVAEISSLAVIVAIAAPKLYRIVRTAPGETPAAADAAPDGDLADLGTADVAELPREEKDHHGPTWALRNSLGSDTLALGVQLNLDHQERRPDVRPGPGTPAFGTAAVRDARRDEDALGGDAAEQRPTWALRPRLALPGPRTEAHAEAAPMNEPGDGEKKVPASAEGSDSAEKSPSAEGSEDSPTASSEGSRAEASRSTEASEGPPSRTDSRGGRAQDGLRAEESRTGKSAKQPADPSARSAQQERNGRDDRNGKEALGGHEARQASRPSRPSRQGAPVRGDSARGASVHEDPARTARHARVTPGVVVLAMLLVSALGLYWVPASALDDRDLDRMGGLGLISVLPQTTLVGAALLVVVFASLLWANRQHRVLLLVTLLATVVSLHALPAVIETEPRFATAWQHLGFMDYIDRTGSAVPDLDARWSWPGFFAAATFIAQACGVTDMTEVIRWWPLTMQLLYLAPMFLLMRSMRAGWRAKWTGVWIFVLSGWVGQDYFSPQGFTYLLYLAFVAILLVWFRAPRVLWTKRRPGELEVEPTNRRQRAVLLLVLIALFAATVPAHQLTPFVMLGVLAVLVLAGRSELRGLPMLFAVLVAVWVGFLAEPYWSGHFEEMFGGIGGVGGNVTSSVSGRIEGGSSTHQLVLYARVALAGGVMALACWGWWRRRDAKYRERSLLVLAFVPFLGFGMQSYGGEMALRVFMFALPGAALLAGLALFPRAGVTAEERDRDRVSLAPLAALMAGLVLMGGFLVARWGNEPFERIRTGEVAAMEYVYAHDDPTVRLLWLSNDTLENVTPAMPWGSRDMEKVSYVPTLAPTDPVLVSGLVKALKDAGPNSYLMVNESQVVYLRMDAGYSENWERRLIQNLDQRQELKKVFANDDATVYTLSREPDGAPAKADPGPIGPQVTWTPWSVVGALAAVALILLLAAREVVRVAVAPSVRQLRWLQSTFWFSLPLLAVLLASLVQRFMTMA